jgi:hypothetical protein
MQHTNSRKGNQQVIKQESKRHTIFLVVSVICRSPLIHVEVDSSLWFASLSSVHFSNKNDSQKSNLTLREINILNLIKPQFHWSCSSPLRWGEHNTSHKNIGLPSQSSWRAHGFHSSKPSRRRQPPRVKSRWRFLEESLVTQSSRTLESSTRISHTHNRLGKACVWRERALKSQVCSSNGQERYLARDGWVFIAHTQKTSRWKDDVHLAVRP